MAKLYFFGDSYTYGTGLCDDATFNIKPSELAYPSLVGRHLNMEVENCAMGGIGNKEIFHRITHFHSAFQPDDIVVVMWTCAQRAMFLNSSEPNGIRAVNYHEEDPVKSDWMQTYYKYFGSNKNAIFETSVYIALTNYYINEQIGNRILNFCTPLFGEQANGEVLSEWANVEVTPAFISPSICVDQTPCGHEGPQTHKKFAKHLSRILVDKLN